MVKIRRVALVLAVALAAGLLGATTSSATTRTDVTIVSTDGTSLAATLLVPEGTPPAGGWPAVIFLHGLGGDRSSMLGVADLMGLADRFAILAYDARGHGQSGGLIGIDGPKEIADVRAVFDWLRVRTDVSDTEIGGWGVSYGGGALWNSLAAGVPWATLETNITWTDLGAALLPQGLVKSGVVAGFIGSLPPAKVDPDVVKISNAAFAGDLATVTPWAAARSSLPALKGVKTPVFMMQGRRDFAFGLDQAFRPWTVLVGPKRLWIGLHGHAPSSFPAADSTAMLAEGARWFDRFLRDAPTALALDQQVAISPENWTGSPRRFDTLPKVTTSQFAFPGTRAIAVVGKVQRSTTRLTRPLEVFGSPVVKVTATATGGWSRLVAVLSARTPAGKEIVVSGGGVPTRGGKRVYTIRLINQATFLPKGSILTLTLGSTSLRQNPANLLYLDLPMTPGARLAVGTATLALPGLATPVSR